MHSRSLSGGVGSSQIMKWGLHYQYALKKDIMIGGLFIAKLNKGWDCTVLRNSGIGRGYGILSAGRRTRLRGIFLTKKFNVFETQSTTSKQSFTLQDQNWSVIDLHENRGVQMIE